VELILKKRHGGLNMKGDIIKNHTAHEAGEARNRAARRFDEIQKEMYNYA
jgi:hypothetical protein